MYLTRIEERMLDGEYGAAIARAMKLIVRVGEVLGAEKLIKIEHAHVSGISYTNIGEPGLEFIEELANEGAKVQVYTTANPIGLCLEETSCSEILDIDDQLVEKQNRILKALKKMGVKSSITCIPYQLRKPKPGEHLAWGESSAVAVANTVYAARTNREGGPIALAAALTGRTYYWGLHLDEERTPTLKVDLHIDQLDEVKAGLIGYIIGRDYGNEKPYLTRWRGGVREAIAYSAAAATAGSTSFSLIEGLSPEKPKLDTITERITISEEDLQQAKNEVATADTEEAMIFFTGCPHHDIDYLEKMISIIRKAGVKPRETIWIALPGYHAAKARVFTQRLAAYNIRLMPGTCLIVSRVKSRVVIATDSVKTALYLPKRHELRVALASLEEFLKAKTKLQK